MAQRKDMLTLLVSRQRDSNNMRVITNARLRAPQLVLCTTAVHRKLDFGLPENSIRARMKRLRFT